MAGQVALERLVRLAVEEADEAARCYGLADLRGRRFLVGLLRRRLGY
jgi:hypothetical protein